jgi:hypothetical protein
VEHEGSFELLLEYIFRILRKDVIECVGITCDAFEELKKVNVMIPEIHEKIWTEKLKYGYNDIVLANASDF